MKTIERIKSEIESIQAAHREIPTDKEGEKKYKKAADRVAMLRGVMMYLEQNPREDFIKEEQKRLYSKIERIDDGFDDWQRYMSPCKGEGDLKERKSKYYKDMNVADIKKQIKTLTFILEQ